MPVLELAQSRLEISLDLLCIQGSKIFVCQVQTLANKYYGIFQEETIGKWELLPVLHGMQRKYLIKESRTRLKSAHFPSKQTSSLDLGNGGSLLLLIL